MKKNLILGLISLLMINFPSIFSSEKDKDISEFIEFQKKAVNEKSLAFAKEHAKREECIEAIAFATVSGRYYFARRSPNNGKTLFERMFKNDILQSELKEINLDEVSPMHIAQILERALGVRIPSKYSNCLIEYIDAFINLKFIDNIDLDLHKLLSELKTKLFYM